MTMISNLENKIYSVLFAFVFCLILFSLTNASADIFLEDFATTEFCDTELTTALWDTAAGELSLHPFELELVGGVAPYGMIRDFALEGDFAYLAIEDGGFQVIDIIDPENPVHVGGISAIEFPLGVAISGDFAYVTGLTQLLVIDITDPAQPIIITAMDGLSEVSGIVIAGDYAYIASGNNGLLAVDISVPTMVNLVGSYNTPGFASSVDLYGDYAYVTDGYFGIAVIDVSDPTNPVHLHQVPAMNHTENICIAGQLAYVTEISSELLIYTLTNPATPVLIGTCALPGHAKDVDVDGSYAYVTVADNDYTGVFVLDLSDPTNPEVIVEMTPPGFPVGVKARGEYAFINCAYDGLQVLRVADPMTPAVAGSALETHSITDLIVSGDIACLLGRYPGDPCFCTMSLADPAQPQIIGSLPLYANAFYFKVQGHYAFLSAGTQGLLVVDYHDAANPVIAANLPIDGTTIYIEQAGNYVYLGVLGETECRLIVVDISDPCNPVQATEHPLVTTPHGFAIAGDYLYISEHEDGAYRFIGIAAIDVSDPENPFAAGSYSVTDQYPHELRVEGNILFASYWTPFGLSNGVELIDITDPLNMELLGAYRGGEWFNSEICLAGDIMFIFGGERRLDVVDVSDPDDPTLMHSISTTFTPRCMDRAGDFLYCGSTHAGLYSVQTFDRLVNKVPNAAQSLPLPVMEENPAIIRLVTSGQPSCVWEISADGGAHWQVVPDDGSWQTLAYQGSELLWRVQLLYSVTGQPPVVDELQLEWLYASALVADNHDNRMMLHQNAPNPFKPKTTIRFELPNVCNVTLDIIDVAGRLVTTLVSGEQMAGSHSVDWLGLDETGQPVSPGAYFYRLSTPNLRQTRKMVLLQ